MDKKRVGQIKEQFDLVVHNDENANIEFWYARELMSLLGYERWENFDKAVSRAKDSCETGGIEVSDHFREVTKMIETGKGAQRAVKDYMLTRYACYLTAQNGDARKPAIAFAQNYFAVQTRRAELVEQRLLDYERVQARTELAETEKLLSGVLYERGVDSKGFAIIRSKGDKALFCLDTALLKRKLGAPDSRLLADFLPTISIKAKDFAAEMASINVQQKDLYGQSSIEKEHIENNTAVRNMMVSRGIYPEQLSAGEDLKKVERRLKSEEKKITKK